MKMINPFNLMKQALSREHILQKIEKIATEAGSGWAAGYVHKAYDTLNKQDNTEQESTSISE